MSKKKWLVFWLRLQTVVDFVLIYFLSYFSLSFLYTLPEIKRYNVFSAFFLSEGVLLLLFASLIFVDAVNNAKKLVELEGGDVDEKRRGVKKRNC